MGQDGHNVEPLHGYICLYIVVVFSWPSDKLSHGAWPP